MSDAATPPGSPITRHPRFEAQRGGLNALPRWSIEHPYVVIAFDATTGIYINGYSIAQLAADDFFFA